MALRYDFVLVVLGRITTALIAVASLRIMTTLLHPYEYGVWSLLVAFQTFGALFLINPVDQHVFRHAHEWWDEGMLLTYLKRFDQYIRLVSIFIAVMVALWAYFFQYSDHSNLSSSLLAGVAVGFIVYVGTWNITLVTLLNVLGFRLQSVVWLIFSVLMGLIFSTILVYVNHQAISWIFGQALGGLIGAMGAWRTLRVHSAKAGASNRSVGFADFLSRTTIVVFCMPLAAATGLMWLQNTGYRFWVNGVWGTAELAILVVGLGISSQLTGIIESLAMQFLYPYFARQIADAKSEKQTCAALSDLLNVLGPIYALWAGFNVICAAALLEMLTDSRYHIAVPFVIFGAMIEFVRCTTNLWSNTARAIRRTKGLILPYGLGAIVVWMGGIGAAHFELGLIGLSSALVIAGVVTFVTMIILMQRLLTIYIDVPRLAVGLSVMVVCFLMAVVSPFKIEGQYQSFLLLLFGCVVVGILIAAMLWRNPALTRLLSTSLRAN